MIWEKFMQNIKDADFIFIIPHWSQDSVISNQVLDETLQGLFSQTDNKWKAVIIDDNSPDIEAKEYLKKLENQYPGKINVIFNEINSGPGIARNVGIKWAYDNNYPVVLYNDADDISNKKRVERVRNIFLNDNEVSVVYSGIEVIDENSKIVKRENLTPSIIETLEALNDNPPQGYDTWIEIGISVGYINLTSATAVKTKVAYKYPFAGCLASEDQHAWFRYSADGGKYIYVNDIPSLYRIPNNTGSASRKRVTNFYEIKAKADIEGFMEAINIALLNSRSNKFDINYLLYKFYVKLADTLYKEQEFTLATEQIIKACKINYDDTKALCEKYKMQSLWDNANR